jgi:hypothetical protein
MSIDFTPEMTAQDAELSSMSLLNLHTHQKAILSTMLGHILQQVLSVRFNEPEEDALRLRQHAAAVGAMEAIQAVLHYDENMKEAFEEQISANRPSQSE